MQLLGIYLFKNNFYNSMSIRQPIPTFFSATQFNLSQMLNTQYSPNMIQILRKYASFAIAVHFNDIPNDVHILLYLCLIMVFTIGRNFTLCCSSVSDVYLPFLYNKQERKSQKLVIFFFQNVTLHCP